MTRYLPWWRDRDRVLPVIWAAVVGPLAVAYLVILLSVGYAIGSARRWYREAQQPILALVLVALIVAAVVVGCLGLATLGGEYRG